MSKPSAPDPAASGSRPTHIVRLADMSARSTVPVLLEPDARGRAALAAALGIPAIRKFRLTGDIKPLGRRDWQFTFTLGATVVQDCVITLEPVTTRIDEDTRRTYLNDFELPEADDAEMPSDDTADPLPATLDLYDVALEALALALPPYPRAPGAELGSVVYSEPGTAPLTDEAARPFAGLADMRNALKPDSGDGNDKPN